MDSRIAGAIFIPYDAKFPIILPKGHRVTNLVVAWYHRSYLHTNNVTIVNEIRQRFHVSYLQVLVRNLSRNCLQCVAKPLIPREAPLSVAMSIHSTFHFYCTVLLQSNSGQGRALIGQTLGGIDYMPYHSCCPSRGGTLAIHRSVQDGNTTIRRATRSTLGSDNDINFLGTNHDLHQKILEINQHL